jgi:enolase
MSNTSIARVDAWEALDSRGNPTVACEVRLADGSRGTASVPSGKSRSRHEAHELRDGGPRLSGLGVQRAVENVRVVLAKAVLGADARDQGQLDKLLRDADGTAGFSRLGANAALSVSVAAARAVAASLDVPLWSLFGDRPLLPMPMVNIFSGGAHAGGAVDVQDVLVIPVGASSFREAIDWALRVRASTAGLAAAKSLPAYLVADEGGLGGSLPSNRAALELVLGGIEGSGLSPGEEVAIGVDIAASQFFTGEGRYRFGCEGRELTREELLAEIAGWCDAFPVRSLEDVLQEDDWPGWATATSLLARAQLIGDDLFATNLERLESGIARGIANAVLVKPNQAGSLSDAARVVERAKAAGYATVASARSGDTEDAWLADLAVGWRTGQIKVGSTTRSERTAKWNRLLAIEAALGERASFAGSGALSPR